LLYYQSTGISVDSRTIEKDSLFIAIKGDRFDGNLYAVKAIEAGAKFAIVEDKSFSNEINIFWVENSLLYLQKLANFHRSKFKIPIIGITGSNGKTSTKELMNCVLSRKYYVLCTKGNLNNHLGVPLTLLQLNDKHELAIIEMGANKPGDIKELAEIAINELFSYEIQLEFCRRGSATSILAVAETMAKEDSFWKSIYPHTKDQFNSIQYYPYDTYSKNWKEISETWDRTILRKG